MQRLREAATVSVGRACGFAGLAILCVMIGLSFDPALSARGGAILTLLLALGLCAKAAITLRQNHRDTETWLLLPNRDKPPAEVAQRTVMPILRETYFRFARFAAGVSVGLWATTVLLTFVG